MLQATALSLFARKGHGGDTYEQGVCLLRTCLHSRHKETRLLDEVHSMLLSSAMEKNAMDSEFAVFRPLVVSLLSLSHELQK